MYLAPSTSALTPRRYCCFSENWEFKSRRKCRAWSAVKGVGVLREWRCGSVNKNGSGVNYEFIEQLSDAQKHMIVHRLSLEDKLELESKFGSFEEDPIVGKLRTRLGTIHPIPSPPFNPRVVGLFVLFFFVGVIFDKVWTGRKREKLTKDSRSGIWPQVPTSFSQFFEKDLQRKESVEWVNMVLGKLWKVYRNGIENWIVGLLQPVIDDLKKPAYVQRVEIKQFSLGEEPLSVRSVERRTSRRVNDLQYQIGIRYTGGARMLLMLSLKFGFFPVVVPVGVRDFDIDGELWVKLRLIPSEPWIGAVTWAFVALPKIKFELAPFRLFNLMDIPVLSMFLTKLLTEDLPGLFVRPKKIYLDFEKGKAVGPVPEILEVNDSQEGNDYFGELSVTLVDARKLPYAPIGKPDPYVVLVLGDQVIRSKKNSQTTVIGPPRAPIWNQDFHLLVGNPRKERLLIQVKDTIGFTDFTVGTGEVELVSLEDTVPTDIILVLRGSWGLFNKGSSGEILLRLTYKAYVEDEDDDRVVITQLEDSDDETSDYEDVDGFLGATGRRLSDRAETDAFMNVLSALLLSEEFKGIVASEAGKSRSFGETPKSGQKVERLMTDADVVPDPAKNTDVTGSVIFWLAVVASISVLIAISIDGSSIFNP